MLSKGYRCNFSQINRNVRSTKHWHKRGRVSCQLCLPGQGKEGHGEWYCFKYYTPMRARQRLTDLHLCRACTMPHDNQEEGCSSDMILFCNGGDICRRCFRTDHVFWTCDGRPHPGSQFVTKIVNMTESNKVECTQYNAKEIEQNCKKLIFLNENDPSKILEKNVMKSDFNNNVLNKSQSINTSTQSALFDKLEKLENRLESNFSKKIESVMLEMENLKESLKCKFEFDVEKCQNDKDTVLDHKTNDYIKNLEAKLLDKENLIKSQNDEIEKLSEKANMSEQLSNYSQMLLYQTLNLKDTLSKKDKSLGEYENFNIIYQQNIEELIALLGKLFPKIREIDSNLDNAAVIKILENFIEELKSDSLRNLKELNDKDKIVKEKDSEIESLKNYLMEYESNRIDNEKNLKDMRKRFNQEQQSVESHIVSINSLNCQIKIIESDLETTKSKIKDSNKHVSILEEENKQLKETVKSLKNSKNETESIFVKPRAEVLNRPFDHKMECMSITETDDVIKENSNQGAEDFYNEQAPGYYAKDFDEYEEFDEYTNSEYSQDDSATEVEEKDDFLDLMVTDKEGKAKKLSDIYKSLSQEENEKILKYMSTNRRNIYEALKDFEYIGYEISSESSRFALFNRNSNIFNRFKSYN